MSPTLSSAGGLNARTRATRFSGSSTRTPGVAANTRPFRSYVPSPGSNSSATAISSPGGPSSIPFARFTPSFRANRGPRYLALRRLDPIQDDVHTAELLAVKWKHVPDWERVREAIRDGSTLGLDVSPDERLGPRVQERVDDATPSERGVEEDEVCVPRLRTEGWIHKDRIERLPNGPHVA